jgi:hypothetical protein
MFCVSTIGKPAPKSISLIILVYVLIIMFSPGLHVCTLIVVVRKPHIMDVADRKDHLPEYVSFYAITKLSILVVVLP